MLMQNFKSAADLGLSDQHFRGLVLVLGALERTELSHSNGIPDHLTGFNMSNHFAQVPDCGTVGCIAGWAEHFTRADRGAFLNSEEGGLALTLLYAGGYDPSAVTTDQAATALRSYLTTGDARWDLAVA